MEKLTKEDLSELTGMTFKIVTVNDSVVRNSDCAFFAALNEFLRGITILQLDHTMCLTCPISTRCLTTTIVDLRL